MNKYGRKIFATQAAAFEPIDPHVETYSDSKGRIRSRKRAMPQGLSKHDANILKSVRRRAHYLDKGFSLFGFHFGYTFILGLIPIAGDISNFLLSYYLVLRKIRQIEGIPTLLEQRLVFNMAVSIGVGLVPLVGDIALAIWKANSRNAALIEEFLIARVELANQANVGRDEIALRALNAEGIDSTGERIGSQGVLMDSRMRAGNVARAGGEGEGEGKKKSWLGFYGWGKDDSELASDSIRTPSPAVGSSTALKNTGGL